MKRNTADRVVQLRKLSKQYLAFVKTSQRFYRQHILLLDGHARGIPELREIAQKLKDDGVCPPLSAPKCPR